MSKHDCWPLPTAVFWVRLSTTRSPLSPSTWMSVSVIKRETTTDINLRYIWIGLRCLLLEVSGTHKSQRTWHVPSTWGATSTSLRPHVYFAGPAYHRTTHFVLSTAAEQTTCTLKSLYLFTKTSDIFQSTFTLLREILCGTQLHSIHYGISQQEFPTS